MVKRKNNNIGYIIGGVVIVILVLWIIIANSGSSNEVTCNSPYIKVGTSCCLDQNSNGVCDSDEQPAQIQYQNFKVGVSLIDSETHIVDPATQFLLFPVKNSILPLSDSRQTQVDKGIQAYNTYNLYLYVYNDTSLISNKEEINCNIEEYYGGVLQSKISGTIYKFSQWGYIPGVYYEKNNTPDKVRYDLDCKGFESGKEYKDTYNFDLIKP